ncbi:MAG: HAMP domain-containing histidine kinase [Turneriella sp.]|nr:HAMP domain-containing histidine kinase [Leptospiraceae bacterium]MCX7632530.1 HAMP domain-containing histidine kinase [Turneriella sp.]
MKKRVQKDLARRSLYSRSALAFAASLLAAIALLVWWHNLLMQQSEAQFRFLASQLAPGQKASTPLVAWLWSQDPKLAGEIFMHGDNTVAQDVKTILTRRLHSRRRMLFYESAFFIALLFAGHIFLIYIYFRERALRRLTEETILLATHELRQPLQSLSLALESIKSQSRKRSKAEQAIESGLADIQRLGEHVRWLALGFGPTKNHAIFTTENFTQWFGSFINQEFPPPERKKITSKLTQQAVALRITESELRFILRNLLGNALHYGDGEVTFSAEMAQKLLAQVFRLRITNGSRFLPAGDFSRIGNAFFRPADIAVQNRTGFGLGLYLSGRLARRRGAKLLLAHDGKNFEAELVLKLA